MLRIPNRLSAVSDAEIGLKYEQNGRQVQLLSQHVNVLRMFGFRNTPWSDSESDPCFGRKICI